MRAKNSKYFLDLKNHEESARTLQTLLDLGELNRSDCYNTACRYAVCARLVLAERDLEDLGQEEQTRFESYSQRALEMLRKAADLGYFDRVSGISMLSSDGDLDALREREDFQALVQELREALSQ